MAVVLTVEEVLSGFVSAVPEAEIIALLEFIDRADSCLDAADVPESAQRIIKLYALRHILSMQANEGRGMVKSESAPSGASRSYAGWTGSGLAGSPFGASLRLLDTSGCVVGLLEAEAKKPFSISSVGRHPSR